VLLLLGHAKLCTADPVSVQHVQCISAEQRDVNDYVHGIVLECAASVACRHTVCSNAIQTSSLDTSFESRIDILLQK
jgi:hypothetical protein